jgi:hypothetical protein
LAFLGFVNGLVPWGLRNYQTFGEVVPVADSTFVHLWMGNNSLATGGPMTDQEMTDAVRLASNNGENTSLSRQLAETQNQPERYRLLAKPTLDAIREDPGNAFRRRLWAGLAFFVGESFLRDPADWQSLAKPAPTRSLPASDDSPEATMPAWFTGALPALLYGSLFVMLGFAALGWRWTFAWKRSARPLALAMIWVPLPFILSHAGSLSGARLPLDGVLLCLAAYALTTFIPGARREVVDGEPLQLDD